MGNSDGGVVLLGIQEVAKGVFEVKGIRDTAKVQKAIWDGLNNRQLTSVNLLKPDSVEVVEMCGESVIRVAIPRAIKGQRPVYIGPNPLEGTYQRRYEGDYRCDEEAVKRMLAEQMEDERDSKLLPGYGLQDLDPASVHQGRFVSTKAQSMLPCEKPWSTRSFMPTSLGESQFLWSRDLTCSGFEIRVLCEFP